jgi:hypothetical protein
MVMVDMICLELALAFVIVATLAAVATTSASRTVKGIASKAVNGSFTAALVAVALGVWFLCWPPTSTVGAPPQLHAQNSSGPEGSRPKTLFKGEDIHEIDLRLGELTR